MKKQLRVILFAVMVLLLVTVTAVVASAATPFSTGGSSYATLEEAVAAVANGGTVTVTENVTVAGDIALSEAKSYTVTGSSESVTITLSSGSLCINAGTVTLKSITVLSKQDNAVMINGASTVVTIESGSYTSQGTTTEVAAAVTVDGSATVTISDGTFVGAVGTYASDAGSTGGTSTQDTVLTINGGTFSQNTKNTGASYLVRLARQYTAFTINGGTFTWDFTTGSYSGGAAIYMSTSTGHLTINGNPDDSSKDPVVTASGSGSYYPVNSQLGELTVNGGRFYSLSGAYILRAYDGTTVTITDGFFTYVDTLTDPSEIDITLVDTKYSNSLGFSCCNGVYVATSKPVRISGGTFMGGDSQQALRLGPTCTNAIVSGGTFFGHRALSVDGTVSVTGGNFYHNPGQLNAKIVDIRSASAVLKIYGGNFDGTYVSAANISTGAVLHFEKAGKAYVYGGTFKLAGTSTTGAIFGMETDENVGGTLILSKGTFTVDGKSYDCTSGGTYTKSGEGSLIRVNADGATVSVLGGLLTVKDNVDGIQVTGASTVTVSNATFTAQSTADIIAMKAQGATLNILNGTFTAVDSSSILNLGAGTVTVENGSFTGTSACLIKMLIPEGAGSLTIQGGTFRLNNSSATFGGAIIRTGVSVVPQNVGQYYDPTNIYAISGADINLLGGVFIDNRENNSQIIDASVGTSRVIVDGAVLLSRYVQLYMIDVNDLVGTDVRLYESSATCKYNNQNYYCYSADASADSTYAPVMDNGAAVAVTTNYEGIRFTSYIPAGVVSALPEGYSFGTLIAPADYVLAAGGFTHALLEEWQKENPSYGTAFVDVPAKYSIVKMSDGSIAFSAALISIQNYTRNLAAVAYELVDGVYDYSDFDVVSNASTMAHVAKMAYTTTVSVPDENHMVTSIYNPYGFTSFDVEEQKILKSYCGYEHTYDVSTVTPSTAVTVGSDASANLTTAATTTLKNALSAKGYTASGAAILVGNTGEAETTTALSEIEGEGYYIGVINGKIVIVGTTNALTMQALSVFQNTILPEAGDDGKLIVSECVASNVELVSLSSDTPIVFSHTRDGNIWEPYTGGGTRIYESFNFIQSSTDHLYNKEGNEQTYVDYPVFAAMKIGDQLDASGYNFTYVPDNFNLDDHTIQIGITKEALANALLGHDAGYYGYVIKDGDIFITAFDDSTLRLAKDLFLADLADFATDSGVYMLPVDYTVEKSGTDGFTGAFDSVEGATGTGNVAEEVKALVTDTTLCPRPAGLQLSGVVNVDSNSLEYYYQNATVANYKAYCALLESKGFTVYMTERSAEGNYFVTYYNSSTKITIHVMYTAYTHAAAEKLGESGTLAKMFTPTLRIIAAKVDGTYVNLLPESFKQVAATGKKTVTKLTSMEVSYNLTNKEGNFGYCYIYTLEDGTFVVLDGGGGAYNSTDAARLYNVLAALYEEVHGTAPSKSNKIQIAAWYLSHGHGDHYGMMDKFISTYCNAFSLSSGYTSKVQVNAIIANFASNDEIYNSMDPNQTVANKLGTLSWYKNNGTDIPYYKVHTGQKFFIGNLEFEVMYTHEDIHPWSMIYYNNTSTVIRLTAHETDGSGNILTGTGAISNLILGDLQVRGSMVIRALWGDYLKSDMVLSAHHGGNGIESECYELIDAQVILWSHCADGVKGHLDIPSSTVYNAENIEWIKNTNWLYIFTGQPLGATPGDNYHYNPTMTLSKDGITGLGEGEENANAFIAAITNVYPGSAGTSFTWGTGIFNDEDGVAATYEGLGIILWRGNFNFEMPAPDIFDEIDGKYDIFTGGIVEIVG